MQQICFVVVSVVLIWVTCFLMDPNRLVSVTASTALLSISKPTRRQVDVVQLIDIVYWTLLWWSISSNESSCTFSEECRGWYCYGSSFSFCTPCQMYIIILMWNVSWLHLQEPYPNVAISKLVQYSLQCSWFFVLKKAWQLENLNGSSFVSFSSAVTV